MAARIILDANFLLVPIQFKIDVLDAITRLLNQRFEPVVLSTTYTELKRMAEQGSPKLRRQAETALKLTEKCHRVVVEKSLNETNDEVIIRVAIEWQSPVATNDRELRRKLREHNLPVIFLRGKNQIDVEGAL